jgi:hypothetical protein
MSRRRETEEERKARKQAVKVSAARLLPAPGAASPLRRPPLRSRLV